MTSFIHPQAIVESATIGDGTRIWAFAHVLPRAVVGADCNLCDGVFVENDVRIGDRVTVKNGVQLWDGVTLEDDVFVGPNATFTNDPFPRSRQPFELARTVVRRGASIGANATLLPGVVIGANAVVGAGAVVTRSVPPNAIVLGNPAQITGYVDAGGQESSKADDRGPGAVPASLAVRGATLHRMPLVRDIRGALTFAEVDGQLPFVVQRYFLIFDVPSREVRGEHAHRSLHEFLVCLRGSCSVALDDGSARQEVRLDDPTKGLHVAPGVWRVHYKYSPDAILLVLASERYDAGDYVRDYDEFKSIAIARRSQSAI